MTVVRSTQKDHALLHKNDSSCCVFYALEGLLFFWAEFPFMGEDSGISNSAQRLYILGVTYQDYPPEPKHGF